MAGSLLPSINHFVVVMLENRSFDHMLGFLYHDQGNVSLLRQPFEGLTGNEANPDGKGGQVKVFKIQATDAHPYFMPGANTGEGYLNTNWQLFGQEQQPVPLVPATNQGFITNFASTLAWESKEAGQVMPGTTASQIMGMYTPQTLPILSSLASGYAVCDHWYGSVPTETFPNRAFVAMATSQGFVQDKSCKKFTAPSIYTLLGKHGKTWAIYGYDAPPLSRGSVADIETAPSSNFGLFTDFQKAVKQGTLANYVFLEPSWGSSGSSQHPNDNVAMGEQFLHDIYYALLGSSIWAQTLLIITYDEHGGCYDHVAPPANAIPPDNSVGELGFDFTRFGPRVPTVLVSPLIPAGTVFRTAGPTPFDHTSILATVEKRFGLPSLTRRDGAAPDVGDVLTLAQARKDDPLLGIKVPKSGPPPTLAPGPNHLEQALADSAELLPVSDTADGGFHHQAPKFETGAEAVEYARQRYQRYEEKLKKQKVTTEGTIKMKKNAAAGVKTFKLGRLHRTYNPRVPHMSALTAGQTLTLPPASVDYTKGMPANLGMMLNDTLGDCTCAAVYHAIQVWTFNSGGQIDTEPDPDVEKLYILACGYNPRVPGEGPGGNEQTVLAYLLNTGAPTGPTGATTQKIAAYVEVDPRNLDDVKRTIHDCGVAYIGFNVPESVMPPGKQPPAVWDYVPKESKSIGGHAVVLAGYDSNGARVISWGQYYTMTWKFFAHFVDEVYAIADNDWIEAKGTTPGGLTLAELEVQMQALKGA